MVGRVRLGFGLNATVKNAVRNRGSQTLSEQEGHFKPLVDHSSFVSQRARVVLCLSRRGSGLWRASRKLGAVRGACAGEEEGDIFKQR